MKKLLSSARVPAGVKGVCVISTVLLLLLVVYAGTAVPLSGWLFYHRAGGVPDWLDRAYIPLQWLRKRSEVADRFFAWQSRRVIVPVQPPVAPLIFPVRPAVTPAPNVDLESRTSALERYLADPVAPPNARPGTPPPER